MSHEKETLALAPAAGAGIGKLVADKLLADPEFVPLMIAALKGGLRAQSSFRGKEGIVECADHRTQIQTVALLLAHMEGEPIKRVVHQHLTDTGKIDVVGALRDSPGLAEAMKREIEKAEWRTSGNKAHKRPKQAEPATIEVD